MSYFLSSFAQNLERKIFDEHYSALTAVKQFEIIAVHISFGVLKFFFYISK